MTNTKQSFSFTPAQNVPPGVAPFSHATRFGNLLFVTGQMPTDPATGKIVEGDVVAQAEQVRRNLEAVLAQFSLTLDDTLMVRVYLTAFENELTFDAVLEDMIARCRKLKLRAVGPERELVMEFTVLLTAKTMQVLFGPSKRRWIAL